MNKAESLTRDLPDPAAANRFLDQFAEKHAAKYSSLFKNDALLYDVLTLAAFSPLLATTLLTHPEHLAWLNRERSQKGVRSKEDLLESLARFELTNSSVEPNVMLARFRRRELLRIFLNDIRRLSTIVEITEEISNLADAILEHALRISRQELDNRYGSPLETDEKGRKKNAEICIVSLGKLGSRELNYSSDIDLLFFYSEDGVTSGSGSRGAVTNREYFVKLAETITRLIGHQGGEGASYRVDLRLRPHGRVGPLAMSVADTVRYYTGEAGAWERQVLIRSRASAGAAWLYKNFFSAVEGIVFSPDVSVAEALRGVKLSKQKIDLENRSLHGTDIKLGRGGIREVEFIAQALQLAFGGRDRWLRAPHTLISLTRLADRRLLTERELTQLFEAYEFLRHVEHILQMENGLQTHLVPNDEQRLQLIARRAGFDAAGDFQLALQTHLDNVNTIFERVFAGADETEATAGVRPITGALSIAEPRESAGEPLVLPKFAGRFSASDITIPSAGAELDTGLYEKALLEAVSGQDAFGPRLSALRQTWSRLFFEIVGFDLADILPLPDIKRAQTALAEASIKAGLEIARLEIGERAGNPVEKLPLAVLGLGKLGGAGIDYESDLDLVLVYDDAELPAGGLSRAEFYGRAAEIFVTALSGMTRDGSLYRVDLRLRPHGKNGPAAVSRTAIAEYMRSSAAIWEMLAYVKLRAVGGDIQLAASTESEIRGIIHSRAEQIAPEEIAAETKRVRLGLEREKSGRTGDVDIKFGPGGMLDIYFSIRYLQLRDNVPDDDADRSTVNMLARLHAKNSVNDEQFEVLDAGYRFLSALDHSIRLSVGRTTKLPLTNAAAMDAIVERTNTASRSSLLETLTLHRLAIRSAFDAILK